MIEPKNTLDVPLPPYAVAAVTMEFAPAQPAAAATA